jgi:sigma-B regulation protein RsbU (phosphoserine phosphatase)
MPTSKPYRILVTAPAQADVADSRAILENAGYQVKWQALCPLSPPHPAGHHLVIIDDGRCPDLLVETCGRIRGVASDRFVPLLFIAPNQTARLAALEGGADACLIRPFVAEELLAQVRTLLQLKQSYDRLSKKSDEFQRANQRLHRAYQNLDEELELARRIQQSMLPQTLPVLPPARFAVSYRPCGRVGGDFYDVFRLDENHIGFYIADVMGHGVPAALLTIFLKKAVQAKDINGQEYRLVSPDDALGRLNREMLDLSLAGTPFITMIYAVYNRKDSMLTFSRAGHPHPVYLPACGEPRLWPSHGTLLGVFDTRFSVQTHCLGSGDKVLFYTDGIDSHEGTENKAGIERLLALAANHRLLPIDEFVSRVSRDLHLQPGRTDDLTLLGMEIEKG